MNWFGESWGAPVCDDQEPVETPVGMECIECSKLIQEGDQGYMFPYVIGADKPVPIAYHRVCFLRTIIPCEMWTDEMLTDMPEIWVRHRKEKHNG